MKWPDSLKKRHNKNHPLNPQNVSIPLSKINTRLLTLHQTPIKKQNTNFLSTIHKRNQLQQQRIISHISPFKIKKKNRFANHCLTFIGQTPFKPSDLGLHVGYIRRSDHLDKMMTQKRRNSWSIMSILLLTGFVKDVRLILMSWLLVGDWFDLLVRKLFFWVV